MAYRESNGQVGKLNGQLTDDVTWPQNLKLMTQIRLEPNMLKTAADAIYQQSLITR